jgi:hypothetical protein
MEGFRSGSLNEVLEKSTKTEEAMMVRPRDPDRPEGMPET